MVGPVLGAAFALSPIVSAIQTLYKVAGDLNDWMDGHIADMKSSTNPTVSRTGSVLEGAKFGFGLGYTTPVTIMAVGQFLLGNTLAAVATITSAATFTNPIAMTCAAVGAIYYGWGALSDQERNDILDKISVGLSIGIEFVKSVVTFVILKTKDLLNSQQLSEIKEFIRGAAAGFGMRLGDVTRAFTDRIADTALAAKELTVFAAETAANGVVSASRAFAGTATEAAELTAHGARQATQVITDTASNVAGTTAQGAKRAASVMSDTARSAKEGLTGALDLNRDGSVGWDDVAHAAETLKSMIRREGDDTDKKRNRTVVSEGPAPQDSENDVRKSFD